VSGKSEKTNLNGEPDLQKTLVEFRNILLETKTLLEELRSLLKQNSEVRVGDTAVKKVTHSSFILESLLDEYGIAKVTQVDFSASDIILLYKKYNKNLPRNIYGILSSMNKQGLIIKKDEKYTTRQCANGAYRQESAYRITDKGVKLARTEDKNTENEEYMHFSDNTAYEKIFSGKDKR